MSIWSTFRHVPAIAPEAMAWATLSFATYLAATEMSPQAWGRTLDPLALALAVQMVLSVTKNMTAERFTRLLASNAGTCVIMVALITFGLGCLALFASAATAASLFVVYFLAHAALLSGYATYAPQRLPHLIGTWTLAKRHRNRAVMLEAAGLVVTAATLVTVWTFADPLAFAAMMSFGVLIVRVMCNWIIVLYLLDAEQRPQDRGGDT